MECKMCHTYVHDALRNPIALAGTTPMRAMQYAYLFVPEFVRIGHKRADTEFASLLFVEAGGVKRSCHIRDPMAVARVWVKLQLQAIGDLDQVHFFHSGGFAPEPAPEPAPAEPLRIRIPPRKRSWSE